MATWKKVIVSGSRAHLTDVTASAYLAPANTTGFVGTASYALAGGSAGAPPTFSISASNGGTLFGASADTLFFTGSNGLVATFTDNGSTTTASFGVGTTAQVTFGGVTASLSGNATSATSASTTTNDTSANSHFLIFVPDNNGSPTAEPLYTDAGISYVPNTNTLTLSGDLAVNGGDITSTASPFNIATSATSVTIGATTNGSTVTVGDLAVNGATSADITTTNTVATVFNTTATNVSAFGAATTFNLANNGAAAAITIGSATSNTTFGGNVIIAGNLDINGTLTTIDTTNLLVADRFILLASGSTTTGEGGIVVQQATNGVGELFGWDNDTSRWAVTGSYTATGTSFTPDAFMAAAIIGAGTDPSTTVARYNKGGNIFIGTDENIWIYS